MELEKEKSVFNLSRIFQKMASLGKVQSVIQSQESKEYLEDLKQKQLIKNQQEQASKLLEAKMFELYFKMVANGYVATNSQNKLIDDYLINRIESYQSLRDDRKHNASELVDFIQYGYIISEKVIYSVLNLEASYRHLDKNIFKEGNLEKLIEEVDNIEDLYGNKDRYNNYIDSKAIYINEFKVVLNEILKGLNNVVFTKSMANKLIQLSKESFELNDADRDIKSKSRRDSKELVLLIDVFSEHILKHIKFEDFLDIARNVELKTYNISRILNENDVDRLKKAVNFCLDKQYTGDVDILLNETKNIYMESYLEKKTIEQAQIVIKNYDMKEIPDSTNKIIEEIKKSINLLKLEKNNLSHDEAFLIENLFEKRIPEILQKYLSIPQEYREILKTEQGENPLALMEDTLKTYKDKINEILLRTNMVKMRELKVANSYSKNI